MAIATNAFMKDLLTQIFSKAAEARASDIHIEPREEFVKIRFRVDGILLDQEAMPKNIQPALISAVKVLCDLDISESRLPQDGKYNLRLNKKVFDLRVSTLPTIYGEKVVIRMLERSKVNRSLSDLGFRTEDLLAYKRMILRKSGMMLISGPTGSGKTTTLYATLAELNHKENNIVTIEDPVEYQLPGINQVQVNYKTGLTFPRLLRSVLRQDPDIILVGEIRDLETARISVQAALTGHLVLSTLHAKDSASAATRLVELGIEDYLVKDVLVGVVSQRLVRVKPEGRRAIFEIMEGFKPKDKMRSLIQEAERLLGENMTTKEEIARVLDYNT